MTGANSMKDWEKLWTKYRPSLVAFAFRMTGSLSEAEDLVQDSFMATTGVDPSTIENPKAWLVKICSNKCLDHLKSAYKKREDYRGPWLPDAIPDSFGLWPTEPASPERELLLRETLTTSFLLMAERLSPEERVVYLLSEVFEYNFKDVAEFINKSEEACRKIAQRARQALDDARVKFTPARQAEKQIARFFELAQKGDEAALKDLLAEGSEFWSDSGGKVAAAPRVLTDRRQIAAFFKFLGTTPAFRLDGYKMEYGFVNGGPGLVISKILATGLWTFETVISFEMDGDQIARIYAQRNPDKLAAVLKAKS
jgi:RNA polymerase sigma-70 factor (ECF subfamily)